MAAVIPLLLKYQGTGKIHAVVQEEYMTTQEFDLDGYLGLVQFWGGDEPYGTEGWRYGPSTKERPDSNRGRGLVIQASRNEFYLVGAKYRLRLLPKPSSDKIKAPYPFADRILSRLTPYLSVDEGYFNQNGEFVPDRRRNSWLLGNGVWVEPEIGVVRVIMCD